MEIDMALIGFARVSTREQDLSLQLSALKEAGCIKIFHGKHSGASEENDEKLRELVSYIRDGDIVLVTKLDRLGRSLRSILKTIDSIHAEKASLKTLDGAIDTTNESPFAKAQLSLIGTFSQLERDLIVARTSEGRLLAKSSGVKFGRPTKLSEQEITEVRKLFNNGNGLSKNALSKKFGVSRMTIARVVS